MRYGIFYSKFRSVNAFFSPNVFFARYFHSKSMEKIVACLCFSHDRTFVFVLVMTGVIIPLVGVLFGYSAIFLKVRSVKLQIRRHQQALILGNRNRLSPSSLPASVNPTGAVQGQTADTSAAAVNPQAATLQRPQKPGFTVEDVKLAKTLFMAFLVFLICW